MQASMKPPSPLLAPEQRPLKPPSPLQPKNAPKTPISQPQRRRRFQLRLGRRPQRRRRFQPHTGTSAQRRWRFQTTGPPGRQSQAAVPVGGGWASPQHPWAISVTNVVKPEQFEPPCECSCYERRQSASKNLDFQRKSRRIDDVCNNGSEIHTAERPKIPARQARPHWGVRRTRLQRPWAAAGPGRASRRGL